MHIPEQLTAGDSVTWKDASVRDSLGNLLTSADWALTYILRGETALTLTGAADGQGWQTTMTAAQSATLKAGRYFWQASVSKGDERITLYYGELTVLPNLAYSTNPAAYDGRSQAEQDLAALEAEIRARITGGASIEYSIGNRSLKRESLSELRAMRAELKRIVVKEKVAQDIAQGRGNPRNIFVSFGL